MVGQNLLVRIRRIQTKFAVTVYSQPFLSLLSYRFGSDILYFWTGIEKNFYACVETMEPIASL